MNVQLTPEEQKEYLELDESIIAAARVEPNTFIEQVMKHEKGGAPIVQSKMHEEWQDLASTYNRLLIWAAREHGKTQQFSIGRVLFELGRNPDLRVGIWSNTANQASTICKTIASYIDNSPELRQIFPNLMAAPEGPWHGQKLKVRRRPGIKDASVFAFGIDGNVQGCRFDLLIIDDILDLASTRTPSERQKTWDHWIQEVAGCLTDEGRVLCVGTAFHPDDALHRFSANEAWKAFRYPVVDDHGLPRWIEAWDMERIEEKRKELGSMGFAQQMMCVARSDSESRFKKEAIDACIARGEGVPMEKNPGGWQVFIGVDLAIKAKESSGFNVLFANAFNPQTEDRQVLEIQAGKGWGPEEIVGRIIEMGKKYNGVVVVEANGAQDYIPQWVRSRSAVKVVPHTTGREKHDPNFGVEGVGYELSNRKWIIPSRGGVVDKEVSAWITEMLYYDPKAHTGDRLMAAWFTTLGAKRGSRRIQYGSLRTTRR